MAGVTQKLGIYGKRRRNPSQKDKNLVIFQFISVVLKELRRHRTRSALTISGVALSVCVLVSLLGLGTGYRTSLINSIDRLGYHVLVTSKGCPYEAATLLMQGGVIPMYMDEAIHREILRDADVATTTRLFLGSLPVHREGFSLDNGNRRQLSGNETLANLPAGRVVQRRRDRRGHSGIQRSGVLSKKTSETIFRSKDWDKHSAYAGFLTAAERRTTAPFSCPLG